MNESGVLFCDPKNELSLNLARSGSSHIWNSQMQYNPILKHSSEDRQTDRQTWLRNLDVVGNNGDVLEVQSGINLIHDVQRCWLVMVKGKDQSQRAQCLLASWQVWYVLPRLLGRPHTAQTDNVGFDHIGHKPHRPQPWRPQSMTMTATTMMTKDKGCRLHTWITEALAPLPGLLKRVDNCLQSDRQPRSLLPKLL